MLRVNHLSGFGRILPAAGAGNGLLTNLVAYWKMDEASGNALDAHGSTDLTDSNTVTAGTGKINGARSFASASSESFSVTDNAVISTGDIDFTFCCWVNIAAKGADQTVLAHWTQSGNQKAYVLDFRNSSDRFRWYVSADGLATTVLVDSVLGSPSISTWYFIHCWHDATSNEIGLQINNGTAQTLAHAGGVLNSTSTFWIGVRGADGSFWNGLIDEVGMWKRLLSAADVTALYNSGNGLSYDSFTA